jgi:hypothetical protein
VPCGRTIEDVPAARELWEGGTVSIRTGTGILDWKPESFWRRIRRRAMRKGVREVRETDILKGGAKKAQREAIDLSWKAVKCCRAGTMDEACEGGKREKGKQVGSQVFISLRGHDEQNRFLQLGIFHVLQCLRIQHEMRVPFCIRYGGKVYVDSRAAADSTTFYTTIIFEDIQFRSSAFRLAPDVIRSNPAKQITMSAQTARHHYRRARAPIALERRLPAFDIEVCFKEPLFSSNHLPCFVPILSSLIVTLGTRARNK